MANSFRTAALQTSSAVIVNVIVAASVAEFVAGFATIAEEGRFVVVEDLAGVGGT